MSEFNQNGDKDTFLSRVFGLHSVYNQLHDNYDFFEPDDGFQGSLNGNHLAFEGDGNDNDKDNVNSTGDGRDRRPEHNLLDSEPDLDLSLSLSSPPSPTLPLPLHDNQDGGDGDGDGAGAGAGAGGNDAQVHWSTQSHPNIDDESRLAINVPSPPPPDNNVRSSAQKFLGKFRQRQGIEDRLPLYNQPQLFIKPGPPKPSSHTLYQRRNNKKKRFVIPPKERALYLWANITNMDDFLTDIYYYYRGKGMLNIIFGRIVDLAILIFILSFTVFLKWGIDYDYFFREWSPDQRFTLHDLIVPHFIRDRVPVSVKLLLFGFACYIALRLFQLYFDFCYKLKEIKNFYHQLINISDDDELMTISWMTIVERLMQLKDYNSLTTTNVNTSSQVINDLSSKVRLNAHDIANRIMRKENYMIALINKDILDLSLNLPVPSPLSHFLSSKSVLTKTLEWNLKLCINNFIFNYQGQINPPILKDVNRNSLAKDLSARFKMAAIINLILCPFIVIYFVLLYFFRYFNEYKSNPSLLVGLRQYTPLAEWKLREFNELSHLFIKRLHLSIGPANTYINQFPQGFLVINLKNFVNFVSGSITAVLVIMGLWFDNEEHNFWSFEITENKTTLFYISLFGTLWAITTNSLTPANPNTAENANTQTSSFFYDPEASLRYVAQFTHYLPRSWNNKLHTLEVKNEFCELFSLKILIIVNELLSLILTPFILWFKVLQNSGAIIDFFREYSIHVDGLGYVCYFAMFNFEEKDKNMMKDMQKRRGRRNRALRKKHGVAKGKPSDNIELVDIKQKRKEKAKMSDSDISDADGEDISDLDDEHYYDDKTIKSYMYFLESYGNGSNKVNATLQHNPPNEPNRRPTQLTNGKNQKTPVSQSIVDPSTSLLYQPTMNGIEESSYNMNYNFDNQDEEPEKTNRSGVLGMINQFYKHDRNR